MNAAEFALTGLLAEPQRRKILEGLQEDGSARMRDLSVAFQVSEATIRQDLERLEGAGHIARADGKTLILDAGTTTTEIATRLDR